MYWLCNNLKTQILFIVFAMQEVFISVKGLRFYIFGLSRTIVIKSVASENINHIDRESEYNQWTLENKSI